MKKVIFICLLSLTMCVSQQNSQPDAPVPQQPAAVVPGSAVTTIAVPVASQPQTPMKPEVALSTNDTQTTAPSTSDKAQNASAPAQALSPNNETQSPPPSKANNTSAVLTPNETTNSTKPETHENKAGPTNNETAIPKEGGIVDPNKTGTKPDGPTDKVNNGTKTDDSEKKTDAVTPKGETVKTTEKPVVLQSRAFDGPSFIGGIILTLGLLAIGFMGFKYYKNQTERNYHTL